MPTPREKVQSSERERRLEADAGGRKEELRREEIGHDEGEEAVGKGLLTACLSVSCWSSRRRSSP